MSKNRPQRQSSAAFAASLLFTVLFCGSVASKAGAAEPSAALDASPGSVLFNTRCGSCHTVGQGDRVGPDLLGVTKRRDPAWIAKFVRGPGAAIDGGDPIATALVTKFNGVRMPNQDLSDAELAAVLQYFEACTAQGGCKPPAPKVKRARDATADEVAEGRQLFEGTTPLANGGPPCISCHSARDAGVLGGGTLASDLTHAIARLGEAGLTSGLSSSDFPLMKEIYGQAALTESEAFRLKAFLYKCSREGSAPRRNNKFVGLGLFGALACFGAIGAGWRRRQSSLAKKAAPEAGAAQ